MNFCAGGATESALSEGRALEMAPEPTGTLRGLELGCDSEIGALGRSVSSR